MLWILPSAVAAARWAPDVLWTRLHSHSMPSVSLEQSLWFWQWEEWTVMLDPVHVWYSYSVVAGWFHRPQRLTVNRKSATPQITFAFDDFVLLFPLEVRYFFICSFPFYVMLTQSVYTLSKTFQFSIWKELDPSNEQFKIVSRREVSPMCSRTEYCSSESTHMWSSAHLVLSRRILAILIEWMQRKKGLLLHWVKVC